MCFTLINYQSACIKFLKFQGPAQSETSYSTESKLPVDWSTQYNSDQQTFVRTSPQSNNCLLYASH